MDGGGSYTTATNYQVTKPWLLFPALEHLYCSSMLTPASTGAGSKPQIRVS